MTFLFNCVVLSSHHSDSPSPSWERCDVCLATDASAEAYLDSNWPRRAEAFGPGTEMHGNPSSHHSEFVGIVAPQACLGSSRLVNRRKQPRKEELTDRRLRPRN